MDKKVGERLRFLRKSKNFSQEKLAEKINLTFQQLQKYERGINRISAGNLHHLSEVLNCSVLDFYPGADEKPQVISAIDARIMQIEQDLKIAKIFTDYALTGKAPKGIRPEIMDRLEHIIELFQEA